MAKTSDHAEDIVKTIMITLRDSRLVADNDLRHLAVMIKGDIETAYKITLRPKATWR